MPDGLGFCRRAGVERDTCLLDTSPRLHGDEYSSSISGGGVGLPSGLSQKPLEASTSVLPEELVLFPLENPTLADQKLVSFIDLLEGRSMMKRPSCDPSQNPPRTASDVQT